MEEKNKAKHSNSEKIGKNLKEFDLEAAKLGKPVCTRGGRRQGLFASMGGNWRMPTREEYKELCLNTDIYLVPNEGEEIQGTAQDQDELVTIKWTSHAEGTLKGIKFYKKGDKETYMFLTAAGIASGGSMWNVGKFGGLWASSFISPLVQYGWYFLFVASQGAVSTDNRFVGLPVRGVLAQ